MRVAGFERKFSEVDGASDLIAALKALRHPKSEFFRSLLNELAGFGVGAEGFPFGFAQGRLRPGQPRRLSLLRLDRGQASVIMGAWLLSRWGRL